MSKYTSVVSGDSLSSLQAKTLLSTQNLLNSMIEGRQFFTFGDRVVNCQKIDVIRWLTDLNSGDLGGLALRNLIVNSVVSSEFKQGGSGAICLITLIYLLNRYGQDKISGSKTLNIEEINKEIEKISCLSKRASTEDVLNVIKTLNSDPTSYTVFEKSIKMAGGRGSIYVEKHASDVTKLTRRNGYEFPGNIPEVFLAASGARNSIDFLTPKICIIDGIIERVSEINGLIHSSYKQQTPLIIVARGFNGDVQNTLGVNFNSGNLSVVPFCVPYDEFGANLVNDICVVSGCDIISSLKGEVISSVLWEDLSAVEKTSISLVKESLIIENSTTKNSVDRHKHKIRKKFIQKSGVDLETDGGLSTDVLEKRLSCLMGDGIRLSIGEDLKDSWGITKDRVETQIKILKDGSKFGVVDISEAASLVKNKDLKFLLNTFKRVSPILTSRGLFAGLKTGIGATKMIGEVGGIVYFDQ